MIWQRKALAVPPVTPSSQGESKLFMWLTRPASADCLILLPHLPSMPPCFLSLPGFCTHWDFCLEHLSLSRLQEPSSSRAQLSVPFSGESSPISQLASHSSLNSPSNTVLKLFLQVFASHTRLCISGEGVTSKGPVTPSTPRSDNHSSSLPCPDLQLF